MTVALLLGVVCGFVGSIPIAGPTAVLVVERALRGHARDAALTGVGAALAEAGYALLAFLGMTAALSRFPWLLPVSRVVGALILVGVGLFFALRSPPRPGEPKPAPAGGAHGAFLLGLIVTGINPTLLASWSAVVTILHGTGWLRVEPLDAFPFALGVGLGVAGWFLLFVELLRKFREKIGERALGVVVRVLGGLMVAGGVALSVEVLVGWLRG